MAATDITPARWYHRLWWRLRTLRPRTSRAVLWGHRGLDRSPLRTKGVHIEVTIAGDAGPLERALRETNDALSAFRP